MRERGNEGQSHGPGTVLTPSPDSWEVAWRWPQQEGGGICCGPRVVSRDQGADLEWQGIPRIRSHAEGLRSKAWLWRSRLAWLGWTAVRGEGSRPVGPGHWLTLHPQTGIL